MTTEVSPTPAGGPGSVWAAERPPLKPLRLLVAWLIAAPSLLFAAWVVPGVRIPDLWAAAGHRVPSGRRASLQAAPAGG